jgi:hypothetical protein
VCQALLKNIENYSSLKGPYFFPKFSNGCGSHTLLKNIENYSSLKGPHVFQTFSNGFGKGVCAKPF